MFNIKKSKGLLISYTLHLFSINPNGHQDITLRFLGLLCSNYVSGNYTTQYDKMDDFFYSVLDAVSFCTFKFLLK